MKGWFDAFRTDGGPTLYAYSNRTPVTVDVQTITIYLVFVTIFLAFLIIFPGVRKEKFTTFTTVTLSLFVGTAILVSRYGCAWHVASTQIISSYRAFSREKIVAELGSFIGLSHVNITLRAPIRKTNWTEDIDFNERFSWQGSYEMEESYREALVKGLPFPVLTVAEYFSLGQEGFDWGGQYRSAGYYGSIMLWASFCSWLLMNTLLVSVPRYGAYTMVLTGVVLLATNVVYYSLLPIEPMVVRFEGGILEFRIGWCFWLVFIAGCLCLLVGCIISVADVVFPNRFSTILEVDYDTPYDRHIIIEESCDTRNKKKKGITPLQLENPPGIGSKLLRRLSNRDSLNRRRGIDNLCFDLEPPKSPWRYPFHPSMEHQSRFGRPESMFQRSDSRDSGDSSCTGSSKASTLGLSFLNRETGLSTAPDVR